MDESSSSPSQAIIIGNCLSCQGLVRVPSKAPSTSRVRCPHCSESYALWQILDQAVPELELLADSEQQEDVPRVDQVVIKSQGQQQKETFVVPPQLSKGAVRPRRRRRRSDDGNISNGTASTGIQTTSFDGIAQQESASGRDSSSRSSGRSSSRREPRRQRDQTVEILKVAIGGILAIPIAYLLLFWVFNQDPLKIGPQIGKVIPFIVPSKLRGDEAKEGLPDVRVDNELKKLLPDYGNDDDPDSIMDVDPDRLGGLKF